MDRHEDKLVKYLFEDKILHEDIIKIISEHKEMGKTSKTRRGRIKILVSSKVV